MNEYPNRNALTALILVLLGSDNETLYLDMDEFKALLDAAVDYMHDEQDTRGFERYLRVAAIAILVPCHCQSFSRAESFA